MIKQQNFLESMLSKDKRGNKQYMLPKVRSRITRSTLKVFVFSLGAILSCSIGTFANEAGKDRGEGTEVTKKPIEQVLKEHTDQLMSIRGVVGTGQGLCSGEPCIKVFVSKKTLELEQEIPKNLEGYPVVIQETGKFKALPDN
jgi:hypothetical protein